MTEPGRRRRYPVIPIDPVVADRLAEGRRFDSDPVRTACIGALVCCIAVYAACGCAMCAAGEAPEDPPSIEETMT